MSDPFQLTGVDATYRTPGNFLEIEFAQGASSAAAGARQVVFVMPKTSTGTWTAGQLYPIKVTNDAKVGAGTGSPLHRAVRKFLEFNKDAKIWGLPYAETTGGSPIAATSVLTLVNAATATGTLSVTICGELCQYSFASGDSITAIGDGIVAVINAKDHLPVTAANASGTVTITAKIKGTSQGDGTTGVIRTRCTITSGVATTATMSGAALGLGTGADGVEGTTTEAAQITSALAAIDSVRKYYVVTSANLSASLAILKTHIANKSEPRRGLRSTLICAYTGALAAGTTLFTGLNYERMRPQWQPNSERDCAEIAGYLAAAYQKGEQVDAARNFNGIALDGLSAAYDTTDWPDDDDIEAAINAGMSPISSSDTGAALVTSLTARSKNGSVNDSRVSRTNVVSVCDQFSDDLLVRLALNYGQKKFKDDERLADGSINPNQRQIRDVVRPSMIKGTVLKLLREYNDAGLIQEVEASRASLSVTKSETNPGRALIALDLHVISWLDQTATRVAEVTTG